MNLFGIGWSRAVVTGTASSREDIDRAAVRREWDSMRAGALTDRERAEIDAMFSRYL